MIISGVYTEDHKKASAYAARPPAVAAATSKLPKGRVSQIEQGMVSGHEVLLRFAAALGGQLRQSIHFDDGDVAAIA